MERIKQNEEATLLKKSNAKRRLEFEIDDTDNDDGNTDKTQIAKKSKVVKCKKCRAAFHNEMLSFENKKCRSWLCKATCWPKRFNSNTDFFVLKNIEHKRLVKKIHDFHFYKTCFCVCILIL